VCDRLCGTDEGTETEFNPLNVIIENYCRPSAGHRRNLQNFGD
jgi:hypothetical protein